MNGHANVCDCSCSCSGSSAPLGAEPSHAIIRVLRMPSCCGPGVVLGHGPVLEWRKKERRNQKEEVSGNTKPSHVSQSGYSVNPTKTRLTSYSLIWGGLTNLRFLRKPLFEWMRCVPPNVSKTRVLQYPSRSCPRPVLLRRSNQTFIHWKWKQ